MTNRWWLAVLVLAFAAPLAAQEVTDEDRFRLFTECADVGLGVIMGAEEGAEIGLTEIRISTMARSRLRAARIYGGVVDSDVFVEGFLSIVVEVYGDAAALQILFWKYHTDRFGGRGFAAAHIKRPVLGFPGDDTASTMQRLTEIVDTFIDEYLRVKGGWVNRCVNVSGGILPLLG